jgi:hypothetical protein
MTWQNIEPRLGTAYHEASHAVVASALGMSCEEVVLSPSSREGYASVFLAADPWDAGAVAAAGIVGERMFSPIQVPEPTAVDGDILLMADLAAKAGIDATTFALRDEARATAILGMHGREVREIAGTLIDHGRINGYANKTLASLRRPIQLMRREKDERDRRLSTPPPTPARRGQYRASVCTGNILGQPW